MRRGSRPQDGLLAEGRRRGGGWRGGGGGGAAARRVPHAQRSSVPEIWLNSRLPLPLPPV